MRMTVLRYSGLPLSEFNVHNFQEQMALATRHRNFKWYPLQRPALNCHLREDRAYDMPE